MKSTLFFQLIKDEFTSEEEKNMLQSVISNRIAFYLLNNYGNATTLDTTRQIEHLNKWADKLETAAADSRFETSGTITIHTRP